MRGGGCFGLISSQMPGPAQAYGDRLRGDVHAGSARVVSGGPNYLVQSGRIARVGGEKGSGAGGGEGVYPPLPPLPPLYRPPPLWANFLRNKKIFFLRSKKIFFLCEKNIFFWRK